VRGVLIRCAVGWSGGEEAVLAAAALLPSPLAWRAVVEERENTRCLLEKWGFFCDTAPRRDR
jgi:hypothetical protein